MLRKDGGKDEVKETFMKRNVFFGFFLFSLLFNVFGQAQQLTVAVSPFQARNGHTDEEAEIITELFTTQLVSSGAARVVARNSFDRIMTEMRFQASDWADNNKVARLGAALNANSIITGQLMKLGNQTIITANLLDIQTVQIVSSSRMQLDYIDQVFNRMPTFVEEMIKNLPVPNYFIGIWRVVNTNTRLEFRANGTFSVRNHSFSRDWTYFDNSKTRSTETVTIDGTYQFTRNSLDLVYTERRVGEWIFNDAGRPQRREASNVTEEKRGSFRYSIDPARNTLRINDFLLSENWQNRNSERFTYINDFIR